MLNHTEVRSGAYYDSVVLMRLSDGLRQVDGVQQSLVAMGTELNLALLGDLDFDTSALGSLSTADMIVAIRAGSQGDIDQALAWLSEALVASAATPPSGSSDSPPRTLGRAAKAANANIVIISIPGANVVPEAVDAIRAGAATMIFSDGVSIQDERRLKQVADDAGVLVMGPDCGTALVGGVALGFANKVRAGTIGIVAASGTGAQHLSCLLDAQGLGISHILGVGGRDLHDDVGGLSTLRALALLDADPGTDRIVLVSKPPGSETALEVRAAADALSTPVTIGLLGPSGPDLTQLAQSVTEALDKQFTTPRVDLQTSQNYEPGLLAGLFSGGTLASEARQLFAGTIGHITDIDEFGPAPTPTSIASHEAHVLVDLGDDRMTVGRPHPMIDSIVRRDILVGLATDASRCRHVFLDVVLGYAAAPDPAGDLADAISRFLDAHIGNTVTATVVGTNADPQGLDTQRAALLELGCDVFESNAMATAAVEARLTTEIDNG